MSYHVYIVKQSVPDDDDRAWLHVRTLLERRGDESGLPPDPAFLALIDRLAARYPGLCNLPEDPESNNAGYSVTTLCLAAARLEEGLPLVMEAANALDLVVFDGQQGKVFRPAKPQPRYPARSTVEIYRVVITGIRNGFTKDQAVRLLAPLFKRTEDEVRRLLARQSPVVKTGVGKDVAQDDREAARWFSCCAEQGDAEAQYQLGMQYLLGLGVPQHAEKACDMLRLAAGQGHAAARSQLAKLTDVAMTDTSFQSLPRKH